MRTERVVVIAGFLILLIALALLYTYPLKDNDLWWQMKIGEYLLEHRTIKTDHSIFSWTIADTNWVYNTWFAQISLYFVYLVGGIAALHVIVYLTILVTILLFLFYLRTNQQAVSSFYLIACLIFAVGWHFNSDLKPETFSFIILNGFVFVYFYSLEAKKDLFWLYPLMMLVWVNSHGAFVFGCVFLLLIFCGEVINRIIKQPSLSDKKLRNFLIYAVISVLTLIITPYGLGWITSIYSSFSDTNFMRQGMELAAYKNIFTFAHPVKYLLVVSLIVFIFFTIMDIIRHRTVNIAVILINLFFIYISFKYARSAFMYFPVWIYTVAWYAKKLNLDEFFQRRVVIFSAIFLVICLYLTTYILITPRHYKYLGFGVSEYMPDKVSDFLIANKIEGKMFNTYEIGGYLMWRLYPQYKIFIDPRHGPYTKYLMDDYRIFELGNVFNAFTDKYPFDIAIVHITWNQLLKNFYFSPQWKLLYFDQSAALFVKKGYDTSRFNVDLKPQRFEKLKSYDGMFYTMNLYFIMEDYDSARYMLELLKKRYNYGMYKDSIESVEGLLRDKR